MGRFFHFSFNLLIMFESFRFVQFFLNKDFLLFSLPIQKLKELKGNVDVFYIDMRCPFANSEPCPHGHG